MTKAISVRLERPNTGSLQLCKLLKYKYRIKKTSLPFISLSLGTSHICQRIVISCDMGHVILMLSHITPMFSPRLSVTNVRLATWCGIIWISHPPPPYPLPTPSNMPPFSTGTFSCLETSWRCSFRIIRLNSKFERHKYMHSVACLRVLIQGSLSVISQSSYDHIKQKLNQISFKYFISFICRCIWYFYCCGWFWLLMLIVDVVPNMDIVLRCISSRTDVYETDWASIEKLNV